MCWCSSYCFQQALEQVKYRVEWARFQERERQKEEEKRERERGEITY